MCFNDGRKFSMEKNCNFKLSMAIYAKILFWCYETKTSCVVAIKGINERSCKYICNKLYRAMFYHYAIIA